MSKYIPSYFDHVETIDNYPYKYRGIINNIKFMASDTDLKWIDEQKEEVSIKLRYQPWVHLVLDDDGGAVYVPLSSIRLVRDENIKK